MTGRPRMDTEVQLLYAGFDQVANTREYKFDGVCRGGPTRHYVVGADLALFLKHHVGMQEGPALCLRLLIAELHTAPPATKPRLRRDLNDQDMLAYLATRPVPAARKTPPRRWKPRPQSAVPLAPRPAGKYYSSSTRDTTTPSSRQS